MADGLGYLRRVRAHPVPLWCLKTAEKLVGRKADGSLAARRQVLEHHLSAAGLVETAELEFALVPVIAAMERAGVGIDVPAWSRLTKEYEQATEDGSRALAGLGLTAPEDAAAVAAALAGRGATPKAAKAGVPPGHPAEPLVQALQRYRRDAGLYWGTCRTIQRAVERGRVRATVDPLGTVTGRMTCSKPNLLSVPKNPAFRRCIVPAPGHVLVVADYSVPDVNYVSPLATTTLPHRLSLAATRPG